MKSQQFRTQCAWCGKVMSDRWLWVEDTEPDAVVSHGICPSCSEELGGQVDTGHQVLTVPQPRETVETLWGIVDIGGES